MEMESCDDDGAVGNTGCSGNPDSDCAASGGTGTEDCRNKIDDNGNCPGDTNGDGSSCNMGDTGVDCLDLDCAGPPPETQCYGYPLHYCDDDTDCTSVFGAETFCDTDFGTCDEGPDGTGCGDGQDNDGDGYIDCSDWGCSVDSTSSNNCAQYYSSGGMETDIVNGCSDVYDNDFDGYTDCVDGDCASDPACASGSSPSEDCSDGLDNDGDGEL